MRASKRITKYVNAGNRFLHNETLLLPKSPDYTLKEEFSLKYPKILIHATSQKDSEEDINKLLSLYKNTKDRKDWQLHTKTREQENQHVLTSMQSSLLPLLYERRPWLFHHAVEAYISAKTYYTFCLKTPINTIGEGVYDLGANSGDYLKNHLKNDISKIRMEYSDLILTGNTRFASIARATHNIANSNFTQKYGPKALRLAAITAGIPILFSPDDLERLQIIYKNKFDENDISSELRTISEVITLYLIASLRYPFYTIQSSPKNKISNLLLKTKFTERLANAFLPEHAVNEFKEKQTKNNESWGSFGLFRQNTSFIAPFIWYVARLLTKADIIEEGMQQALVSAMIEASMAATREHKIKQELILSEKVSDDGKTQYDIQTEFFSQNPKIKSGYHAVLFTQRLVRDACFQVIILNTDKWFNNRESVLAISAVFAAFSAITESIQYEYIKNVYEKIDSGDINNNTSLTDFLAQVGSMHYHFINNNGNGLGKTGDAVMRSLKQPGGRVGNFLIVKLGLLITKFLSASGLSDDEIKEIESNLKGSENHHVTCNECGREQDIKIDARTEADIGDSEKDNALFLAAIKKLNNEIVNCDRNKIEEILEQFMTEITKLCDSTYELGSKKAGEAGLSISTLMQSITRESTLSGTIELHNETSTESFTETLNTSTSKVEEVRRQ